MSIIELSQLGHIDLILVIWNVFKQNKLKLYEISHLIWPHPFTHTQPIGGGVSINQRSLNRIELSQLGQDLFDI